MVHLQRLESGCKTYCSKGRPVYASDFANHVSDRAVEEGLVGFHLTIIYRQAETPASASAKLDKLLLPFLKQALSINLQSLKFRDSFTLYAFLDEPCSRANANRARKARVAEAQDSYHHHCILLVRREFANVILKRLGLGPNGGEVDLWENGAVRSIFVQPLPTSEDIERATSYAAKMVTNNLKHNPDEAYRIYDGYRDLNCSEALCKAH